MSFPKNSKKQGKTFGQNKINIRSKQGGINDEKKTALPLLSPAIILTGAGILNGIFLPKEKPEKYVGKNF